ncbi:ComF family protein [Thiorhodovibrio frisius]|uniref:ComF family protein n=1 Tax=Thiorhodovibrio frisius TaxID=631362 RepID=UPI000255DD2C|nr:ComF family protein [Thiorhodovibrio frisius]
MNRRPEQGAEKGPRLGAKADKLKAIAEAVNHDGLRRLTAARRLAQRLSRQLLRLAFESAYPPTCVLCGAAGFGELDLCLGCLADLPDVAPSCERCALPLPAGTPDGIVCGKCQRQPPAYDRCIALFRYQGAVARLVGDFKFRQRLHLGRLFGQLLAEAARWQPDASLPDLLVPVPLHPSRLRQRGYNQSLEVARVAGRALGIDADRSGVERVVATPPQLTLAREERQSNVRNAFRVRRPLMARHVAIIDDVVTTGATVGELARVLRQAGAERVDVWAVARTP